MFYSLAESHVRLLKYYEEYEVQSFTIKTRRALSVHMEPYEPLLEYSSTPGHGLGAPFQPNLGTSVSAPLIKKDADLQLCHSIVLPGHGLH